MREWAMVAGAMVATALIYAVYPLMHTPVAMGVCSVLLGLRPGLRCSP